MAKATVHSLTNKEQQLVAQTQKAALADLDEDGLDELLTRVRRARNKYVKLYRNEVAEQVPVKGARGAASRAPRRSAGKAEIFEDALARVSTALGKAARESAATLKAERLAAAAREPSAPKAVKRATSETAPKTESTRGSARKPVQKKAAASTKAAGARKQAKKDAR